MACVLIDINAFANAVLRGVIFERVAQQRSIMIAYCSDIDSKFHDEIKDKIKIKEFYKLMQKKNRIKYVNIEEYNANVNRLLNLPEWNECGACDDEHIFAIIACERVRFLITMEKRLAVCREKIKRKLPQEYTGF